MKRTRHLLGAASLCLVLTAAAAPTDPLETGFLNPPDSAKPQTWWHWMNGNITKAGITADLEAMKQIGLGGATIVNVDCGIPAGPVEFMSPQWREDFKFAIAEANRLGLEMTVENCAGWSSSGGPWNTAANAMQRVTTSEVRVTGPTNFSAALPPPPTKLDYYRDIAVLAFPAPDGENVRMQDFSPVATTSGGEPPGNKLTDGDAKTIVRLPSPKRGQPQFAQLKFQNSFSARSVMIVGGKAMPECRGEILVSDDGKKFRALKSFAFGSKGQSMQKISLGAQPVAARFWRVQFTALGTRSKATEIPLAEIELSPQLTIDRVQQKDGYFGVSLASSRESDDATAGAVQRQDMVDLTSKLTADGKLNWQVPAGQWVILRIGYTPTGVNNHPAAYGGEGLECDKFSQAALDAHWAGFMQKVLDDLKPLGGRGLAGSLIDSYEVGGQNWNRDFRAEFQKRRGYDPLKYLPTFTGRFVDSPAVSERFLWDIRRTIADLFAENYFGYFAKLCHQHGLISAVEPYEGPFEAMQSGASADFVMGEFWSGSQGHESVKLVSSIAHIYGKTFVGAESFTASPDAGRWKNDPYSLKTLGDLVYCQGLNRYVFHRYAMQPWTNHWPGMTMGQWGFHFERTETWWEQGKAWIDYISHCQFLLQQGRAVQDAAYFTGESAPVMLRDADNPALPAGYDYDGVNADVLRHATVKNGRIVLASGANYAVLILPKDDPDLTPQMLQCLTDLVRAGATVVGPRPEHSPSLADYPQCDAQIKKMADKMWGNCDGKTVLENSCGRGHVFWGKPLGEILAAQKLKPDFEFAGAVGESRLLYNHRVAGAADIYFVSNQRRQFDSADCTFRVVGKVPELWHPDTGVIEPATVWSEQNGRAKVRLNFDPAGSVFVVFRHAAVDANHVVAVSTGMSSESSGTPKLEIQHAVYAATDGAGQMDVTAKLSELTRGGQLVVTASNDVLGRDPIPDHAKELRVDYTLDGKPGHAVVKENETLALPATLGLGQPPVWETTRNAINGNPVVKAWGDGNAVLTMAGGRTFHIEAANLPAPLEISGEWNLSFPPNWGAPPSVALDKLIPWAEHPDPGVKYFSGTATYEKDIEIPAERLSPSREVWLDLGAVKNFAQVSLNGQEFGVLWKPPFRLNITAAAKPGANKLVVKVTNLWPNRLIGDEQLPDDREWNGKQLKAWPQWFLDGKPSPTGRLTFTTWHHWTKDDTLLESGLLGPVRLQTAEIIPVK